MGTRRGGKRTAGKGKRIGPPPNPVKGLKTSAATAQRILRDLDYENQITEIYRNGGDFRLKVQILHKLEERAFGPAEEGTGRRKDASGHQCQHPSNRINAMNNTGDSPRARTDSTNNGEISL